jgi:hypothetical protein
MNTDQKTLKQYRKNLRVWFERATPSEMADGLTWYGEANAFANSLSMKYGVSPVAAAGVISALSPNNKWERNKIDAESVIKAALNGVPEDQVKVCTYNANKAKAFKIAKEDAHSRFITLKESPKTFAFAKNVGDRDESHVTIDKWHLRAMQTISESPKEVSTSCTPKQYRIFEAEALRVAKEKGMKGYEFQAIVWVTIRNRWMNG